MKIKLRSDYKSIAEEIDRVEPTTATEINYLDARADYLVLFMAFRERRAIAYIDLGAPWAEGFDLRLFDLVDSSLPVEWRVGNHYFRERDYGLTLIGPEFWAADPFWYELLLDNDEKVRLEYAEYLRAVSRR